MTDTLTRAVVEHVPVSDVHVGIRRRKSLGRLEPLQRSIEAHGLIHPIVIRNGGELVAGGRRLAACTRLGWKTIPARRVETMSDEELRAIELEENSERVALNDFDASAARGAEMRQAAADQKTRTARGRADTETRVSVPVGTETPKAKPTSRVGRPAGRSPGSMRDVEAVTGIPIASQKRINDHVAIATEYPFMQKKPWVMHQVLHAGAELERLPEPDRPKAAALLDQEAIPPKKAIAILENLATLPAPERKEIFKLAQSDDTHDRRNALSRAAALPPVPDPGLMALSEAEDVLRRAVRSCRTAEFKVPIKELSERATALLKDFDEHHRKARVA